MARKSYVQVNGKLIPKEEYAPDTVAAMIMPDIQPYFSQATGQWITSRSHHRNMLREHRLVEIGNETKYLKPKPVTPPPGRKQMVIEVANAIKYRSK